MEKYLRYLMLPGGLGLRVQQNGGQYFRRQAWKVWLW